MAAYSAELKPLLIVMGILVLLIIAIFTGYLLTNKTVSNLQQNTLEAATTFKINGLLQDMVNETNQVDFSIRKQILSGRAKELNAGVADTLLAIRQKHAELKKIIPAGKEAAKWQQLLSLVEERLQMVDALVERGKKYAIIESLSLDPKAKQLNDTIYYRALQLQNQLESELFRNLNTGSQLSGQILLLSRVVSIVAILAFALLGTFLIRRLLVNANLMVALRQSKLETESLASVKEEFLANMSHEIRNPLHAINGYAQLLQQTVQSNQAKEQLQHMNQAISVLMNVVDDVLDVSKMDGGKLRLEPAICNLHELCANISPLFAQQAAAKGLAYEWVVDQNIPPSLLVDAARLRQLLFNLVGNAIKFTETGWVKLRVTAHQLGNEESEISFEVSDSGMGIDPKNHQRIFNRFEQVKWDKAGPGKKGTGLGLSIVKGLVQLMGGTIVVNSALGKGASFTMILPFAMPKAQAGTNLWENTPGLYGSRKVLVAEDSEINRALVTHMLEGCGISPILAHNGQEAVDKVQANGAFDLVLMDLQMPVMDGYEATELIKKMYPQINVVAMTANTKPADFHTGTSSLFGDWLQKPFTPEELKALLVRHLAIPAPEETQTTSTPAAAQAPIDSSAALPVFLVKMFVDHFPPMMEALRQAIETRDEATARKITHNMAGALGVLPETSATHRHLETIRSVWHQTPVHWVVVEEVLPIFQKTIAAEIGAMKANLVIE